MAELARQHGDRLVNLLWTIGAHDLVAAFDMPDEASFTALALEIAALGTAHGTSLRALNEDEFQQIAATAR